MMRLLSFSGPKGEYVVVTDEEDALVEDYTVAGYKLSCEIVFTPEVVSGSPNSLPLGYELYPNY